MYPLKQSLKMTSLDYLSNSCDNLKTISETLHE